MSAKTLDVQTGKEHKLFEDVSRQGRIQNILKAVECGIKFVHFLSVFFFRKVNLKQIEEQKYGSRRVRGYASPESFQKFRHCNGHFSAF